MPKLKSLGIGVSLLAAAGVAVYALLPRADRPSTTSYKTAPVERGSLTAEVGATGVVEAQAVIGIKSRASGQIVRFSPEEGDEVKQGQLLIELDGTEEQRSLQVEVANLRVAQAEAAKAKALLDSFAIEHELDLRAEQAKVAASQAQLDQARAALALFQKEHPNSVAVLANAVAGAKAELATAQSALTRAKQLGDKVSRTELEAAEATASQRQVAHRRAELELELARSTFALRVKDKQQEIARLEAALQTAVATRERLEKTAKQTRATRQSDLHQAQAKVTTAEVQVARAKDRLEFTKIYAELDGVIVTKTAEKGQVVSSGTSSASGGDTLATLADLDVLYVTADVDESDIGKVLPGQEARIKVDTYPDMTFRGRVMRIAPQGVEENNVVLFKVKIRVFSLRRRILRSFVGGRRGPDLRWARALKLTEAQKPPLIAAFQEHGKARAKIRADRKAAGKDADRAALRARYVEARRTLEAALEKHMTPAQYALYNRRLLRIGMSAEVTIQTGKVDDALLVPTAAIRRHEGKRGVFVLVDGEPTFKALGRVQLQTGERSAVTPEGSEVQAGDAVVVRGMAKPKRNGNRRGLVPGGRRGP